MISKHFLYHKPKGPLWKSQERYGTTFNLTYHAPMGMSRKEVIQRYEVVAQLVRTLFHKH